MRTRALLFILIALGLVFSCEKKKQKEQLGEFLLGSNKDYNPFSGSETLVYWHSVSKTKYIFYGDGRYSELFEYVPTHNPTIDYWINERDICSFTTMDKHYTLRINMSTYYHSAVEMYLDYGGLVEIDKYHLRGLTWKLPLSLDDFTYPPSPHNKKIYHDSLQIFDKWYNEVFGDSNISFSGYYPQKHHLFDVYPTAFYYTITDGIIRIDLADGSFLGLTEIISP